MASTRRRPVYGILSLRRGILMAGGDSTITKTTPPANKPARWRRVWKVLRWVLAAPLVLVLVVLMAAHTSPAKERLRARVEQRLQQRLRGKVTLEAVDYALFGDVTVQHLSVYDEQGKEVVGVDKLLLRPDWWALVSGQLVLDQASLNGVRVQLVAHEDGTTNLKRLLKPNPPKPPKPARQPKKKTRIVVRNLDIGPVELNYDKFDGTHIGVRQLMLGGSLDVTAGDKTAHVSLPVITSNFTLSKQQALTLALNKFKSGIELDLTAGAGTLTVARTQAKASIERQHKHDQLDIDLAGIQLDIAPGKLGATLDHLLAGALLLDALELQRTTDDKGNLVGTQKANVIGLKLDAKRLNNLLHREILRRDVRFDTSL
ncbi:MAG TPA: hypothetical protein ENK23_02075, partial [Sorangium sp.]|nr:hypothetical protein [Sorangium sp.]